MLMVISVQCPSCSTSFPVDTAKVPAEGVYARCSVCSGVFFVEGARGPVAEAPAAIQSLPALDAPAAEPWAGSPSDTWTPPAPPEFEISPTPAEAPAAEASPAAAEAVDVEVPEPFATETHPEVDAAPPPEAAAVSSDEAPASTFEVREAPPPAAVPPAGDATPAQPAAFTFGRRDPHEKARRLARVLVSDMIMYNRERHTRAVAAGSLREDFDDEIKKSWEEYLEQVGEEIAKGTSYFDDALNEILAQGQRVFP
jgi:predicted Zn finger-like uncharacterized protein